MKYNSLRTSIFSLFIIGSLSACSTEFDVLAPYKEVPVIYGLISIEDTLHVIKVNKGFNNEGRDANDIAQNNPDSINYGSNLEVLLINTIKRDTLSLRAIDSLPKEAGLFSYPDQITYVGEKILNPEDDYKLLVVNKTTGTTADANTDMVGKMELDRTLVNVVANFYNTFNNSLLNQRFDLSLAKNGTYVSFDAYVNIIEYYSDRDSILKTVRIQVSSGRSFSANASNATFTLPGETFVTAIQSAFSPANDPPTLTSRTAVNIDVEVYASTRDFERYFLASRATSAISQTRPFFTNINNGLGLFTSRGVARRTYPLSATTPILLRQRLPDYKF